MQPRDGASHLDLGPSTPGHERRSPSDKELMSIAWTIGATIAASLPREPEDPPPPIAAVYLSDDASYENGAPGQRKSGAFQWLRRHLSGPRDG